MRIYGNLFRIIFYLHSQCRINLTDRVHRVPSYVELSGTHIYRLAKKKLRLIAVFGNSVIYRAEIKTGVWLHRFLITYPNFKSISWIVVELEQFVQKLLGSLQKNLFPSRKRNFGQKTLFICSFFFEIATIQCDALIPTLPPLRVTKSLFQRCKFLS